jgi:CRP-like cAMP-binding protein
MGSGLDELGITDDDDGGDADSGGDPEATTKLPTASPKEQVLEPIPMQDVHRVLEQITLFNGLPWVHLHRIARLCQHNERLKDDFVFRHGDEGDGLYLILEGAVRISRTVSGIGEEALAVLKQGQYFGEMSIVDDEVPRSADAICHERTRLLKLPKDELRDLMFVDRELAYELLWRFIRTLSGRLRESNDRLMMLTVSSKF